MYKTCSNVFRESFGDWLMADFCNGITSVDFEGRPPAVVLDLGCGSGSWATRAATTWPVSYSR